MLSTDDRALLVDLLTPPADGYRLERAVGTTFTLNLESLLRIPLAVAGAELQEQMDPLGVLHAVQSSMDRIDVFCQTGMVRVPAKGTGLLAFLEPIVHQVSRPRPGRLFHPKIWLLSFTDEVGERRMRFLCGSRNLTADRTWDTVLSLEGKVTGRPRAVNRPLSDLVASLPARSVTRIDPARENAVGELAELVRHVEWEPPEGVTDEHWLKFHVFGDGQAANPDMSGRRRLVIAPFLTAEGLERVWPDGDECTVISRAESFAALEPDYRQQLVEEFGGELKMLDDAAAVPDVDAEEAGRRWELAGLHAKVYVVERNRRAHVFIGSANATSNGWSGNDEVLVEIVGRPKALGVKRVLAPGDASLANVLTPFVEGRHEPPEDDPLRRQLEHALIGIAEVAFHARATERPDGSWSEAVTTSGPLPPLPEGVELSLRLVSSPDERTEIAAGPVAEGWHGLAAEDLTPFIAVALRARSGANPMEVTTTVLADLTGAPEDRLDRLVARHVGSPEAFLRFILMLLHADDEAAVLAAMHGSAGGFGPFGVASAGVLESLVLALAERPQLIDDVGRIVDRLNATEQGRKVLPAGWDQLWSQVSAVRRALEGADR